MTPSILLPIKVYSSALNIIALVQAPHIVMASFRQVSVALSLVLAAILGAASYAEGQILFSKLSNALIVAATLPSGEPITGVFYLDCSFLSALDSSSKNIQSC